MAFRSSNTRANYSSGKTFQATPVEFLLQQVVTINPLALPLWLGGLYFLFFVPAGKPYRAFGWAYVFLFVFFMLQKAKFYWLSPAYPALFAAGAYGLQRLDREQAAAGMAAAHVCRATGRHGSASGAVYDADPASGGLHPAQRQHRRRGRGQAGSLGGI